MIVLCLVLLSAKELWDLRCRILFLWQSAGGGGCLQPGLEPYEGIFSACEIWSYLCSYTMLLLRPLSLCCCLQQHVNLPHPVELHVALCFYDSNVKTTTVYSFTQIFASFVNSLIPLHKTPDFVRPIFQSSILHTFCFLRVNRQSRRACQMYIPICHACYGTVVVCTER